MGRTQEITIGDTAMRANKFPSSFPGSMDGEVPNADTRMFLNMGPSHPATHGVLRLHLELDGDLITRCTPIIGYLHRGDEKLAENLTYNQFVPYTDRLDYLAPLANNIAYALAVEKLAHIETPPRCQAIRVICCELARISSHLLGVGVYGMDTGAWTIFMYTFTEREKLYTLFEELTGARFTTNYARIGGLAADIPGGWLERVLAFCDTLPRTLDEIDALLARNKIFLDRTKDIAPISKELAIAYALTGANLRASGVPADLRKDRPYCGYENYDFDIPIGTVGDCYDRYLIRMEEMRQSLRIIRQASTHIPDGPWHIPVETKFFLPSKERVQTHMEELIQNFVLTTTGPQMPAGEVYFEAENPKGALAFYIHSKGGGIPWRLRIRGGSFPSLSILPAIAPGHYITDITSILGSLDFVMGECDR
ncbi:MAG: NADH dehydrogenase (quinone) subunit D [Puniceicoccales bacterium]|jgi:NADH-quinone oxidoreductase subunit D|nr:NADH dehydrogenase (quinone) subunit D [Puniceicoccales bacterium]